MRSIFAAVAVGLFALPVICHGGESAAGIAPFNLAFGVVIADLNNDGLPDIAVAVTLVAGAPPHPGFVSVILQNAIAPGTFLKGVRYATGTDPLAIASGDLNGDGLTDLVVADSTSASVSILMQDPSNPGTFLPKTRIVVGGSPSGVAIGDFDGDGRADIAVAAGSAGIKILFQDPSGPPGTFMKPFTVPLPRTSSAVAIGDVNGDGVPDLVSVSDFVSVVLQDAADRGTFLPPTNFRAGLQPSAVKIGDLNGDGLQDLAVANYGAASAPSTASVAVLLQDPVNPGSFLRRTIFLTGARTTDVGIADLNGDGRSDLVTANTGVLSTTGSVSVLLQKPPIAGKLAFKRKNYPGRIGPWSVAIGDLNGDGKPDIAVADGNLATVRFQNPNVPGTFLRAVAVGQ